MSANAMIRILFRDGQSLDVPCDFAKGCAPVFHDSDTIPTDLEFDRYGDLISRIARVCSSCDSSTRVRLTAKIVSLETRDIIRVLEFSNYFCHDMSIDIAATTIASRLDGMSAKDIASVFGVEYREHPLSVPKQHLISYIPSFL